MLAQRLITKLAPRVYIFRNGTWTILFHNTGLYIYIYIYIYFYWSAVCYYISISNLSNGVTPSHPASSNMFPMKNPSCNLRGWLLEFCRNYPGHVTSRLMSILIYMNLDVHGQQPKGSWKSFHVNTYSCGVLHIYSMIFDASMYNFEEICQMFIFHYPNPLIKCTSIEAAGFFIRI